MKEVPNCKICKWLTLSDEGYPRCGAQGFDPTGIRWNTIKCKKLYKSKGAKGC